MRADTSHDSGSGAGGGKQEPDQGRVRRLAMKFTGQVQGVGFRWTAQNIARQLGLTGWVRNEWDGSVSMELQGPSDQIARFFGEFNNSYRRYPIRYTIAEKEDIDPVPDEPGFEVRFSSTY